MPGQDIMSWGLSLTSADKSADEIEKALRENVVPIVGYIDKEGYVLDMRTLLPGDEEIIVECISRL